MVVHFNGKLFFWKVEESFHPRSLNEFRDNMLEIVRRIYGEPDHVTGSVDGIFEGVLEFQVGDGHLIVCLANEESFSEPRELNYEDVVKICERLVDDSYEKQTFVFHDVLPEGEERERLNEWGERRALRSWIPLSSYAVIT